MNIKRRGFFGILGGVAAAPLAGVLPAETAASTQALTGISTTGLSPPDFGSVASGNWAQNRITKINMVKLMFPDEFAEMAAKKFNNVSSIDASILALRSVSLTAKIRMQRDMQIATGYEKELSSLSGDQLSEKIFNF